VARLRRGSKGKVLEDITLGLSGWRRHGARGMPGITGATRGPCAAHFCGGDEGSDVIRLTSFDSSQFGVRAQ
jgi:hypothetical protein